MHCGHNKLTSLLTKNLKELACSDNQLIYLDLNESLKKFYFTDNPISEILGDPYELISRYDKFVMNHKIRVFNNFRHLYYCLKFKKQFRDLLWVKIREPKIRKKYSHDYLVEHLHEETDLDELLENW